MKIKNNAGGFTIVEMVVGIAIIAVLSVIYYITVGSYKEHKLSERAAKTLMQAAQAQERYFVKEHKYFNTEISGESDGAMLAVPGSTKDQVFIPPKVVLSMKALGEEQKVFVGHSFFSGGKALHTYDSREGKIVTKERNQEDRG